MSKVPGTFKHRPGHIIEMSLPPILAELNREAVNTKVYRMDECSIIVCQQPYVDGELRWHLSISHLTRYPTWDEIKVARYALTPADITMVMILPKTDEYVNVEAQDNVFHLHEVDALPPEAHDIERRM